MWDIARLLWEIGFGCLGLPWYFGLICLWQAFELRSWPLRGFGFNFFLNHFLLGPRFTCFLRGVHLFSLGVQWGSWGNSRNQPHLRPSRRLTCAQIHVYLSSCTKKQPLRLGLGDLGLGADLGTRRHGVGIKVYINNLLGWDLETWV